ncbi:metallophosphoesterase family protein, partial [Agromyces aerolatus]|uniref:hypothetical protein n=1 Tax=Agromyces sp. LY-1074 TaxID=3074080 RepID=UPI00285636D4
SGGLGPVPQRIQDEVVAPNPNVKMVLSGHHHDAATRRHVRRRRGRVADRKVYSMLFDYQGLPEGGQGAGPPEDPYADQEFEISYARLGIRGDETQPVA